MSRFMMRNWRSTICGLMTTIVILLAGCAGSGAEKGKSAGKQKKNAVPITIALAERKTMPVLLQAVGNVEAYTTVAIKSQITGELQKVHFKEGGKVKKGDLLFSIDPRPYKAKLKEMEANLAKDLAEQENARKQVNRYSAVVDKGYVSEEEFDQIKTSEVTRAAAIAADRAAVESAQLDLAYCSIYSPIDGFAGDLKADQGNLIKANADTEMVTINQVCPINVSFALPERNLPAIKRYMQAGRLTVQATISGDEGSPLVGELSFIDNSVDPNTGTIMLKAAYPNGEGRLWPGQFVNVVLELTSQPDVTVIPSQALQTGQKGFYIYVVTEKGNVEYRDVVAGLRVEQEVVITQGVQPGEKVVTDGQLSLVPGAEVKIIDSVDRKSGGESK